MVRQFDIGTAIMRGRRRAVAGGRFPQRRYDRIERTVGRRAADDFGDDWERREAARERERNDAEYRAGIEDANRERFNRQVFGEAYAAAEEYARDLRGLNGDW
jgi:hypothetical protein